MVHWVPLESNPDVFTDYAKKLGIDPKWVRSPKKDWNSSSESK